MSAKKGPQDLVNGVWFRDLNPSSFVKSTRWYVEPQQGGKWKGWYVVVGVDRTVSEFYPATIDSPAEMLPEYTRCESPLMPWDLQVSEGL